MKIWCVGGWTDEQWGYEDGPAIFGDSSFASLVPLASNPPRQNRMLMNVLQAAMANKQFTRSHCLELKFAWLRSHLGSCQKVQRKKSICRSESVFNERHSLKACIAWYCTRWKRGERGTKLEHLAHRFWEGRGRMPTRSHQGVEPHLLFETYTSTVRDLRWRKLLVAYSVPEGRGEDTN